MLSSVPMDLGASRRGVDMGPSAIRYAKLYERLRELGIPEVLDHGNLPVPIREGLDAHDTSAKYLTVIERVCEELARFVEESVRSGGLPIVLGGDHSIAMGTLAAGLMRARSAPPGPCMDLTPIPISITRKVHPAETCTACHCGLR